MTEFNSTVVSVVPKAPPASAMQNSGKLADMYRIAAWVIDNGGRAKIKDNYDSQGPDQLMVSRLIDNDPKDPVWETVLPDDWVVLLSYSNFKILTDSEFEALYERRDKLKPSHRLQDLATASKGITTKHDKTRSTE